MGKKTKKKPISSSKKKTKKIQRGGFPFGFNPILKDNIEVIVKDGLDKGAYAQRNKVLPTGNGDWFSFDFNNIYESTYNFFNQTPIENPVKTVKIALNTEADVKKINLLNKMIRKYNSERNIRLRREKNMQKGGGSTGEIALSKDILSSVVKTLDPREMKDAQELIDRGVFDKLLSTQSKQVVERQLSNVDKKHEELVDQNRKLMEEIRNQKRAKEKEDNEEFKKTQKLFAKPENFDKMTEKEKIEYAVNLADKLLNTKTIELFERMQKRKVEQVTEAQKRAISEAANKMYDLEQEKKAALIQKRNLEIENSLISQRLSKLEVGKKIIQEQLDKVVVEKNKAEAELATKTADLTKERAEAAKKISDLEKNISDLEKDIDEVTKDRNEKTAELKKVENDLEKLQNENAVLEMAFERLQKEVAKAEAANERLQIEIEKKKIKQQKAGEKIKTIRKDLAIKDRDNEELQKQVRRLKQVETDLNQQITDEQTRVAQLNQQITDEQTRVAQLNNDLAEEQEKLQWSENEVQVLKKEQTKLRTEKARLATEKNSEAVQKRAAEAQVRTLTANLQNATATVTRLMDEKQELEQRITTAETNVQTLTGQVNQLRTDLQDATTDINQLTTDKTDLEAEVTRLEQIIKDRTDEKNAAVTKINDLKGKKTNSRKRIKELLKENKKLETAEAELTTRLRTSQDKLKEANDKIVEKDAEITNLKEEIEKKKEDIDKKQEEINRINGEIATANGNNTTLTNDNKDLKKKVSDLEAEINTLKTQGQTAAANSTQSAASTQGQTAAANSTQSAASTSASSGTIRQMASPGLASRPAVPAPGKTMGQTLSEYYRNLAENDPNYRKFLFEHLISVNYDFPENLTVEEIQNLMSELLQSTTINLTEQNIQLESLSKKLSEHPEKKLQIQRDNDSFVRDVLEKWAEYSLKYMKMFIPINIRNLKESDITALGGYSPELSKYLFNKSCLHYLANEFESEIAIKNNRPPNISFLKNQFYTIISNCSISNLDFIEAVALYKMLPDDDKFIFENIGKDIDKKLAWKKQLLDQIKYLHKENKTSHKFVYRNQVPTVDLDTGFLDISFKTDDAKKDARMNELKDLHDKLPPLVSTQTQNKPVIAAQVEPAPQKPKASFGVKQKKEPLKEGNKVLYQNVEYVLKKIDGDGIKATYELADISNGQIEHKLNFIEANKLKIVEESSSAASVSNTSASSNSASSTSASSNSAPKATKITKPTFDPLVGDTVKYGGEEYIVKSIKSKTGPFGTVINYEICPKDIGCGVNDENMESVPKIQLKPLDPPLPEP